MRGKPTGLKTVALSARCSFLFSIKARARRLCGAACLLSSPRLATPGGALAATDTKMEPFLARAVEAN